MVNMDHTHRSIKRPRSESLDPTKKPATKKKKVKGGSSSKNKDSDKSKDSSSSHMALETTATAEGQTMTQVLRTLNRTETSRFEAYRRATFNPSAVRDWVSHVLSRHYTTKHHTNTNMNTNDSTPTNIHTPKLEDMTCPGHAGDITLVVSTLAKAYAQRLVTAALRTKQATTDGTLLPHHIMAAHMARTQAGLDPGFFLEYHGRGVGGVSTRDRAAALNKDDRQVLLRNAAIQAQEDYDNHMLLLQQEQTTTMNNDAEVVKCEENEIELETTPVDVDEPDDVPLIELEEPVVAPVSIVATITEEPPVITGDDVNVIDVDMEEAVPDIQAPIPLTTIQPTTTKAEPMSMEDALLLDMDDDDDSSDDDL